MKAIAIAIALAASTAAAQPKPAHPKPAPAPTQPPAAPLAPLDDPGTTPQPAPAPPPTPDKPSKVNPNDTLQNGSTSARPWAAGVSQSEQRTALALFHDGNTELNDGLFAKAADKYEQALKHWDHPSIHYNLGIALMNLDKTIEAYNNFESSMKYGEAALPKGSYESAKNYLVVLGHAIGELWVICNKPGAKVSVDGKPVFTAPGTFKSKVKIGKHSVVAELEGHPTRFTAPDIEPGSPFKIELTLYTVKELTRYKHKWPHAQWMPYTVLGAGVVVGVVGGAMEYLASNKYKDYDNEVAKCAPSCTNSQALKDIRSSGDTYKATGFALYGVGAAIAVSGAILAIVNRSVAYQVRPEDLNDSTVRVQPVVSPSFAGAALSGRF